MRERCTFLPTMRRTGSTMERSSTVPVAAAGSKGVYCIETEISAHHTSDQRQKVSNTGHVDVSPIAHQEVVAWRNEGQIDGFAAQTWTVVSGIQAGALPAVHWLC